MAETANNNLLENEAAIVERAKTDKQAFEILYNHYFPRIYGYIFKRTGNRQIAEDIVSQTFLKVFAGLNNYQFTGYTFGAWIYKIATNNLIDHYRQAGRHQEVDLEATADIADGQAAPDELAQGIFDRETVGRVLAELPENYREIINLKYFAEMSYEEMAEILGTNVNNCRVMIFRALKQFKVEYQKYGK
jgi:RNA polymerase sigma-70 factor (ECF subfamily)